MSRNSLRKLSLLTFIASIATLGASIVTAGIFRNVRVTTDAIFFVSSIGLALIAILFGLFSKDISRLLRFATGSRQIVFSQGGMEEEVYQEIAAQLRASRISIWHDIEDLVPGDDFLEAVYNQLDESDALVIANDPEERQIQEVILDYALSKNIRVIPIVKVGEETPSSINMIACVFWDDDSKYIAEKIKLAVKAPKRVVDKGRSGFIDQAAT